VKITENARQNLFGSIVDDATNSGQTSSKKRAPKSKHKTK